MKNNEIKELHRKISEKNTNSLPLPASQDIKPKWFFIAVAAILLLIVVNLYLFSGKGPAATCFPDKSACIIGVDDPEAEINATLNASSRVILMYEGDNSNRQTIQYTAAALVQLARDFGGKLDSEDIYGIELNNSQPVGCLNYTLEHCLSITPGEGELMIVLKEPVYRNNNIVLDGRTIEFQARSGSELKLLVDLFEQKFL